MTHYSLTGCRSGKSIRHMPLSIPAASSLMTEEAHQFLSAIAPRAYREAMLLAVQLRVTAHVSYLAAISDGLTVRTTFSILTPCKRWKGQTLLRISRDSRLFSFTNSEITQHHPKLNWLLLDTLTDLSSKIVHGLNTSTYHVLTSQKTIDAVPLRLPVRSFGQYPASLFQESKRV